MDLFKLSIFANSEMFTRSKALKYAIFRGPERLKYSC
jgi:hypothetical protein